MGNNTKKSKKSKKETKKHHKKRKRHDTDGSSSNGENGDDTSYQKLHRKEKKQKFRKPKRRKSSSSETSSNYGDMNEILKTPPKHQKMKRIMYRRKIRNIDPDMFVSLKKFAYDKEKLIQQAFLTLRRGVIERICPSELSHLTMDQLKGKLTNIACAMSKERLRTYAEDEDLTHSSDSFEPDTPTDVSDSDMEVVDDDELVNKLFEEKAKAVEQENELRERLARKMAEKALLTRLKNKSREQNQSTLQEGLEKDESANKKRVNGDIEDGEIVSDNENKVSNIPLPPPSPKLIDISDDEDEVKTKSPQAIIWTPPPPPPPPLRPSKPTIILEYDAQPIVKTSHSNESIVRLVHSTAYVSTVPDHSLSNGSSITLIEQLSNLEKQLLAPVDVVEEFDYDDEDMGSEPDVDLY